MEQPVSSVYDSSCETEIKATFQVAPNSSNREAKMANEFSCSDRK
jgi:hypothetical protein